jgi:hypothetical protein
MTFLMRVFIVKACAEAQKEAGNVNRPIGFSCKQLVGLFFCF